MYPQIEYFTTFAITDNPGGTVTVPEAWTPVSKPTYHSR